MLFKAFEFEHRDMSRKSGFVPETGICPGNEDWFGKCTLVPDKGTYFTISPLIMEAISSIADKFLINPRASYLRGDTDGPGLR
jgi:hypothetical protein